MQFSTALIAAVAATLSTATAAESSAEPHIYASHFLNKPPPYTIVFPATETAQTLAPRAESSEPHIYASHFLNKPPPHTTVLPASDTLAPRAADPTSTPHIYASQFLHKPPPHTITMRAPAAISRRDYCDYCRPYWDTDEPCKALCEKPVHALCDRPVRERVYEQIYDHSAFGRIPYSLPGAAPTTLATVVYGDDDTTITIR